MTQGSGREGAGMRDMAGMAALMGEAVEAMTASQAVALALLRAEMDALAQILPGAGATETPAEAEARAAAEEAMTEAGFDNMPV